MMVTSSSSPTSIQDLVATGGGILKIQPPFTRSNGSEYGVAAWNLSSGHVLLRTRMRQREREFWPAEIGRPRFEDIARASTSGGGIRVWDQQEELEQQPIRASLVFSRENRPKMWRPNNLAKRAD
ncbi:hypothetical protein DM860_018158 [Cuscuta australis]|uniref:Uncharacterized protein n=1 Tax=Cuscuta australis TaxID=267555 RepID=A0A328E4J9_9ASTE|nr:hypothetical protein DM860_018158 [Cuscuta australis]